MIRLMSTGLFVLSTLLAGISLADDPTEPPIRLKKKDRPKAELPAEPKLEPKPEKPDPMPEKPEPKPRLGDPKDPADDPAPLTPEDDEKEKLARVSKNMRASEERLGKKDPGKETLQIQRDILKDLDTLIEQNQRSQSQSNQDQQNQQNQLDQQPNAQRQPGQKQAGQQGLTRPRTEDRREARRNSKSRSQGQQAGSRPGQGQQQSRAGQQPQQGNSMQPGQGNQGGQGNGGQKDAGRIADLYKDIWGHLPEAMRMEMDAYSREKFMAKYNDLLKQYYATIAEKGRRKGD